MPGPNARRNGDILITERDAGAVRIVRDGVLLDASVSGVPESANTNQYTGLMEVALHPDDDSIVYLTYTMLLPGVEEPVSTIAICLRSDSELPIAILFDWLISRLRNTIPISTPRLAIRQSQSLSLPSFISNTLVNPEN